jgi:hypothetical protein
MLFRRTRRYGKPRNQHFHHIGLAYFRAHSDIRGATLWTKPASGACNIEMVVLKPSPRSRQESRSWWIYPSRGPLHGIYLQKNPLTVAARRSNSLKCAVILRGPSVLQFFLQCDNGPFAGTRSQSGGNGTRRGSPDRFSCERLFERFHISVRLQRYTSATRRSWPRLSLTPTFIVTRFHGVAHRAP